MINEPLEIQVTKMTEPKINEVIPSDSKKFEIDLDRILTEEIGFGLYQLKAIVICGLVTFFVGYSELSYVFTAARVKTRCIITECESRNDQNFSPSWLSYAVPVVQQSFDNCHRFAFKNSSQNDTTGSCQPNSFDRNSIVKCTEYAYEHNNSAVYEFGLACDEWRWFLIGSSQVLGAAISLPITGYIADRWGRRFALSVFTINCAWINTVTYWSSSSTTLIVFGFFGSFFGVANCSCAFVLMLELLAPKHRMLASSVLCSCYTLGSIILGVVAWTEPNWRHLILIVYLPMFIGIVFYWIVPEPVRWLMSENRFKESKDNLVEAAKMNGRLLSEETVKTFSEEMSNIPKEAQKNEDNLVLLVFKHKVILLRCVIVPIWWACALFINNSLLIASVEISGNKYVNFSAVAAVAIPAYWSTTFIIDRIGRKPVLIGMYWVGGLCQLGYIFIPKGIYALSLSVYLLGKFSMAIVMSILFVYTTELFPTSHRSSLVTFASMVGRLGSFAAPITPALASQVWEHLPFVLFAGVAFSTGLLVFLAPETAGSTLPESMEAATNLGKKSPSLIKDLHRRILSKKQCYSLR